MTQEKVEDVVKALENLKVLYAKLKKDMKKKEEEITKKELKIGELKRTIEVLKKPYAFDLKEGKPLLLVRLGSDSHGWIPNDSHFVYVQKFLKEAGYDKNYNILLNHYAIDVSVMRDKIEVNT